MANSTERRGDACVRARQHVHIEYDATAASPWPTAKKKKTKTKRGQRKFKGGVGGEVGGGCEMFFF